MSASTPVKQATIYTVGHSNRSESELLRLLKEFDIQLLVDIRRFAGSTKWPQFSQANLQQVLPAQGIMYMHLEALGGRRKINKDSKNTAWRHPSFRAYADYMETESFATAIKELELLAQKKRVAIMCSEAVWWRCHRALVADFMKAGGWQVCHIMGHGKATIHPYTSASKLVNGQLSYREST